MNTASEWLAQLAEQAHALIGWEAVAVGLSLAYLLLAMRNSLWCWPAAFISTLIFTLLFWEFALLMESALNLYYMAMAGYGFWQWRQGGTQGQALPMQRFSLTSHALIVAACSALSLAVGYYMDNFTHADLPYPDAATSCFAVVTTWMVARRVVENWLYWIVIDAVSIFIFLHKGLWLTAMLFVVYTLLAIGGYFNWSRMMRNEQHAYA